MTATSAKEAIVKSKCDELELKINSLKSSADIFFRECQPTEIPAKIPFIDNCINSLSSFRANRSIDSLVSEQNAIMAKELVVCENDLQSACAELDTKISERLAQIRESIASHNSSTQESFSKSREIYDILLLKQQQLNAYSDKILRMCGRVGLTPSQVDLILDKISPEELSNLYDEAITFVSEEGGGNIVAKFKQRVPNETVQGVLLLVCLILAFTPVLTLVAIPAFVMLCKAQTKGAQSFKQYYLLLGLSMNIDITKLSGYVAEIDESLLYNPDITDDEIIEADDELKKYIDEYESLLEQHESVSRTESIRAEMTKLVSLIPEITSEVNAKALAAEQECSALVRKLTERKEELLKQLDEYKADVPLLGDVIEQDCVIVTNYMLGLKDGIFPEYVDIGLKNVVIKPSNPIDMQKFLHVMLINALSSVAPRSLSVIVWDPNNLGSGVMEFFNAEHEEVFSVSTEDLKTLIGRLREDYVEALRITNGQDLNEYNAECLRCGKIPRDFKLLVILSQPKNVEEDEALRSFMTYSAKGGILVWVVSSESFSNCFVFNKPFEGVPHPYPITVPGAAKEFTKKFNAAISKQKPDTLSYADFVKVAIPDSEMWKHNADDYIDIYPGFGNGDPTDFKPYTVGKDGDVHALVVGGTGAGKSVFLNQMIISIAKKYHPKDLELWLIDFKGSEFSFYLNNEAHPFALPHIRACLCTSDGAYAASVFKALADIARERYMKIQELGFKGAAAYNARMRQEGRDSEIFTAVFAVCDEFQVIFETPDDKLVNSIKSDLKYLAKVARAANVHVLLASQSMSGTVSADILDAFTLRIALRCVEQVSRDILGSPEAGKIRDKYGKLYTKCITQPTPKLYKTPGIGEQEQLDIIKGMYDKAIQEGFSQGRVIQYNEKDKWGFDRLEAVYAEARERNDPALNEQLNNTIFLGERMAYSSNQAPENILLGTLANTHLIASCEDQQDFVWFFKSYMHNIKCHTSNDAVFINTQVKDWGYLCEIENYLSPSNAPMAYEDTKIQDVVQFVSDVLEKRREANSKSKPMHVILLGWDKAPGFCIDRDFMFVNTLGSLLATCAEYNIHFIFIMGKAKDVPMRILGECAYKVAGMCDEDTSFNLIGSKIAAVPISLKNGYLTVKQEGGFSRCKLYYSEISRKTQSKELVL